MNALSTMLIPDHPPHLSAAALADKAPPRRPRILLAGEFSAGKTGLINALTGEALLAAPLTASALPALWLSNGSAAPSRVSRDGSVTALSDLSEAASPDTLYCHIPVNAPALAQIDLIDTPGTADPDMPADAWLSMLGYADAVIWCSNAVQAWRQSEKAAWAEVPQELRRNATLLLTHAEHLGSAENAEKVLRRVTREAGADFASILLVSLRDEADIRRIRERFDAIAAPFAPPLPVVAPTRPLARHQIRRQARSAQSPQNAATGSARALWERYLQRHQLDTGDLPEELDMLLSGYFRYLDQNLARREILTRESQRPATISSPAQS